MQEIVDNSWYMWVLVLLCVLLAIVGGLLLVLVCQRRRKPRPYSDPEFQRVDGLGPEVGRAAEAVETDAASGGSDSMPEKACPVSPLTNWDREREEDGSGLMPEEEEGGVEGGVCSGFVQEVPSDPASGQADSGKESIAGPAGDPVSVSRLDASHALLLFKSHELLLTLSDGLKKLVSAKTDEARKEKIGEMQAALKLLDAKGEWEQYRSCFELLYPGFWPRVEAASNEEMTPYELRLCALLSLGMGTKEIAELTNRSVRTVETSIYKIRKKLGMGTEDKTSDFLRRFLEK